MLYQLLRTEGGIPGPLRVLFDRTPVVVVDEKVAIRRAAPMRPARAIALNMVAKVAQS